ncbi:serine carboxypeptidase-like protein 13 isoform X1 [Tanacetum coccineum]
MLIPHHSTQAWVKELNYSITDQWRSWKLHGQIVSYTESYCNKMTYATVEARNLDVILHASFIYVFFIRKYELSKALTYIFDQFGNPIELRSVSKNISDGSEAL